jgi:hypothetical protein
VVAARGLRIAAMRDYDSGNMKILVGKGSYRFMVFKHNIVDPGRCVVGSNSVFTTCAFKVGELS